ncbi:DNA polymerase III subunit gamma/tau [Ornithinibacillus sp. 4-3]|uniref:DNA-directed DNA polymerase n=1 Tax=Ornithinibacillus sp. 4-3 TaxID=3231488 RepID=A0AB39HL14_9BACI
MAYQALYRVWRPRTFADLVGQSHITRTLQNAIEQGKFSHAYLFSGPRGTGKTSAAKIFAQAINCEAAPTREPCNQCAACRGILDGSISDVIEIDAASNTSVDHIREIRDKVKYASSVVPYKVYIIDEVHMISVNAFNALLKTLEEPPKHVVFILATTEPHKIPVTIMSRCQRFDFKPVGNKVMIERMKHITSEENIKITDAALEVIALAAEGGMRDALSILDQTISYAETEIDIEDVLAVTGGVSQQILTDIVEAMHQQDVKTALHLLDELIQNGKDPGRFVYDLIYFLRDLLLYKSAPSLENMLERARVDTAFEKLATSVSINWIQQAMMQLNQCQQEIKWTNSPKVFIEIAILSITNPYKEVQGETASVDSDAMAKLTNRLAGLEKELTVLRQAPVAEANAKGEASRPTRKMAKANRFKIPYEQIRMILNEAEKAALQEVNTKWVSFLSQLKAINAPAHATIQDSKPAAASERGLVVAFRYEIHCSLFVDNREVIESTLENALGKRLSIVPIPAKDWPEVRKDYLANQDTPKQEEQDPLVEEARKLFGDELIEVND